MAVRKITLQPGETKEVSLTGSSGQFIVSVDQRSILSGAQRTDMGAPFDLDKAVGIRDRLNLLWLAYDADSGFRYLIDRLAHYGANGFTFFSKKTSEVPFWQEWASRVNEGLPTILPGLREIIKWNMKHLALGGFSYNNWLWGKMRIGKADYEVPVKWTLHNQRSVAITRSNSGFSDETVGIKVEKKWLQQGNSSWAEAYDLVEPSQINNTGGQMVRPKDPTSYFLIKLHTSPGDNTSDDNKPQTEHTAASLYPTPPFLALMPTLKERQQLRAMDLNIVDGFINKLVIWEIGDKDNPPVPEKKDKDGNVTSKGTIAEVKAIITADNKGNVMQLFVPYWIKVEIKTPDINPLISAEKYKNPWIEMLWAFGVLANPDATGDNFKEVNTQNFEQMVNFYREEHIQQLLENVVFRAIAKRNGLAIPEIIFNPLNTLDNEFLRNIRELSGMGKVSTDTLLRLHKLDKKFELPMITEELKSTENKEEMAKMSEEDLFNMNTPVKFKQAVVGETGTPQAPGDKKKTETKVTVGTEKPGRPVGKKDSAKRESTNK